MAGLGVEFGGGGLTMAQNVPLNEGLATVSTTAESAVTSARGGYEVTWNMGNAVRALSSMAAVGLLAGAVLLTPDRSSRP
ncbi:hypothetical protein GCM10022402_36490 [Salinactinospora qingdaonensis]|uniref:Uncharacterized protein n=1 Tax=Salinactinospora qingdaonensis TaxID=702744 RepID=A0ABP7G2G8_9ACTN